MGDLNFEHIWQRAVKRKGGSAALEALMPETQDPTILRSISDDRWLAQMTKSIFQSGFVYRVVHNKWPGFEEVFDGFDPEACARLAEAQMELMAQDKRIIRNGKKVRTVRHNAGLVLDLAREHGSVGMMVAGWPLADLVGLWDLLKKRGSRLGGNTGPYFLRNMGKDTFLLTRDVVRALMELGVLENETVTSKKARRAAQSAFNTLHDQSKRPMSHISRVLACSVGDEPEQEETATAPRIRKAPEVDFDF